MEKMLRQPGDNSARSIISTGSSNAFNRQSFDEAGTPLIGREKEIRAACTLLRRSSVRLLTITGSGGIGKTRLALQIAESMQEDFPDGVSFVALSAIHDPALLVPTIAGALGLRGVPSDFLFASLVDFLQQGRYLLVLDNFEQLVEAGPVVVALLSNSPHLKILVTSRAVLRVQGEYEFVVPPLALPDLAHLPDSQALERVSAVALFIQRARLVQRNFRLSASNAQIVARICCYLDGIPLALELAAVRLKILSPQSLLNRLEKRMEVLTSGEDDLPTRQQTLRNTLIWSYDLLNVNERWLFRYMAAFDGGCSLEAIEALCISLGGTLPVLDSLTALLDNNLLYRRDVDDEPRMYMLETVREYGLELLVARGERAQVMSAHAAYYCLYARQAEVALRGREQAIWLRRLEQDYGNIRAAILWLLERNELEQVMDLVATLGGFWFLSKYISEGRHLLALALSAEQDAAVSLSVKAKALYIAGRLALWQHDIQQAISFLEESSQLFRNLQSTPLLISSLSLLSSAENHRSQFAAANALYEEALRLARAHGEPRGIAQVQMTQGIMSLYRGEFARVRELCKESIELAQGADDSWIVAINLHILAWASLAQEEYTLALRYSEEAIAILRTLRNPGFTAETLLVLAYEMIALDEEAKAPALLEEALTLAQEVGDRVDIAQVLCAMGYQALQQGNSALAQAHYEACMQALSQMAWQTLEVRYILASCLEGRGAIALTQGQPAWAAQLFGAAEALRAMHEYRNSIGTNRAFLERCRVAIRSQLGEEAAGAFRAHGQTLSPEDALAAEGRISISEPIPGAHSTTTKLPFSLSSPTILTRREIEVLRLLAQGMTNKQITDQLMISMSTVNTHVQSIYSKLGIASRSAATRYAMEHHLL
ncbi:MAG TPA: LuxR C-terminal-related transcriptional regulator [Ktedonobacteraceae bacterium]|nr:LuxR C-terminal-related transcriptional regulator [Ktedonobacteraceae bacterium]